MINSIFLIALIAVSLSGRAQISDTTRALIRDNKVEAALQSLPDLAKVAEDDKSLMQFLKARLFYLKASLNEAQPLFEQTLTDKKFHLQPYSHYHLGLIAYANKDLKKARSAFDEALRLEPNSELESLIRFQLADMAIEQKNFGDASSHLRRLEKRWKRDARYPDVLFRELRVELMSSRHSSRSCKLARKLFADYPGHPLVANWTILLKESKVDEKVLGCLVTSKDQIRRIRRLQWAGQSDRARAEIEFLRSKEKQPSYFLDSMLAQFLVTEGEVDDAIQILMRHYPLQKNNFNYLLLLGRAAARAGEYQTAVGAYYKAYEMAKGSRAGREALFQSAFLSYQFQDYDGASRKFEEFLQRYSRSGLRRDAIWHMAWIRYLKGDYSGALTGFENLTAGTGRSRRHQSRISDRLKYWQAMSLMRLNRNAEAAALFQSVMADRGMSYYSLAARYRFDDLAAQIPKLAPVPAPSGPAVASAPPQMLPEPEAPTNREEDESEGTMTIAKDEDAETNEPDDSDKESDEETVEVANFKNARLMRVFDRAQDLIRVGLYEWARYELYEIESHTRHKPYLQNLMALYEKIESYHRSSALADLTFQRERFGNDVTVARQFWESAYPQAYGSKVKTSALAFQIPPELVWSIMRAESQYKANVISPVGAKGLMQLMPQTGQKIASILGQKDFVEGQLFDPDVNIRLGAKYLSRLSGKFENSIPLVAAAYNAGPHRVESWLVSFGTLETDEYIEHIPFLETRDYVKKVVRNYGIYRKLYGDDKIQLAWLAKPLPVKPPKKVSPRETWETQM